MKSAYKGTGIFMAALAILALSGTAGIAEIAPQGYIAGGDLFLLTQNHSKTVAFDIDSTVGGSNSLHMIYFLGLNLDSTAKSSALEIAVANNTPLEKGQEIVYFVAGVVQITGTVLPLFQYIYASGGTYAVAASVPKTSFAVLVMGVLSKTGVDFPITLRATMKFTPVY